MSESIDSNIVIFHFDFMEASLNLPVSLTVNALQYFSLFISLFHGKQTIYITQIVQKTILKWLDTSWLGNFNNLINSGQNNVKSNRKISKGSETEPIATRSPEPRWRERFSRPFLWLTPLGRDSDVPPRQFLASG